MIKLAIIGLGTIGNRILRAAAGHPDIEVVAVYDLATVELTDPAYRTVQVEESAQALVQRVDVDIVYIGTPPATHTQYCHLALDANKAIWCEKPLAVDIQEAEQLVARLAQCNTKSAVNLSLASSPVVRQIEQLMADIDNCDILSVDFQFHYSCWPRRWQAGASNWLCLPEQGGFLREVYSHFVFLHQRLIGDLQLLNSQIEYQREGYAETYVQANYCTDNIPVRLQGVIGGNGPDTNNWIVYTKDKSIHFSGFRALKVSVDNCWQEQPISLEGDLDVTQLSEVVKMMRGEKHKLASFAEALKVQKVVEALLVKG
ncbi:MAG: Gfo/Idh/MocA family oxidoreductase [Pseudomonadales bacterium]|nr:Gfo/Idh/MocA family oxidoreductase [Pseudomonadales bacterium]NRA15854.1 Gfo/Idh/MocA family oxidoreductase [Oceanospirillaceae bacterium]